MGMRMKQFSNSKYKEKKEKPKWLYLFLIGMILGIGMVLFHREIFIQDTYFFGEDVLKRFGYSSIYKEPFFYYVLKKRFSLLVFLIISSVTIFGTFCLAAFGIWFGMSMGVIVTTLLMKYGLKGLWLSIGLFLPQNLVYIPCYIFIGNCLYGICKRMNIGRRGGVEYCEDGNAFYLKRICVMMTMILFYFGGCFLESYVNPVFLKFFLKIF